MALVSTNPATGRVLESFETWSRETTAQVLDEVREAFLGWRATSLATRTGALRAAAGILKAEAQILGRTTAEGMGKPVRQGAGEAEKCALVCEYYADNAAAFLAPEPAEGGGLRAYLAFEPLGTILAVMPWNFPLWQVFRLASPCLAAGNAVVLKHASNVPRCALAIEDIFRRAGLPKNVFRTLRIGSRQVEAVIQHKSVAAAAGRALKPSLLELGGSDPFVVLADADFEAAAAAGSLARCLNAGQTCIAVKRFIVEDPVYEPFLELLAGKVRGLKVGDPLDPSTDVGPLARPDLVEELQAQVDASLAAGARLVLGGKPLKGPGCFYPPTLLANVTPDMAVFREETFGPVAAPIRARDAEHALALANDTEFGLGASIWTRDLTRGEALARRMEAGSVFINGMVKSDPRLPFGGVKASGYGRELSYFGIRQFVNVKTVWVG